jgi:hypothetical protein
MRIGVLGTGVVGRTIGSKLASLGHEVRMGSRTAGGEAAGAWVAAAGAGASEGTFADAARHGELIFNCTSGLASIDALSAADAGDLAGKILIDVANPLDFSGGFPPRIIQVGDASLGERIQESFPKARVVKTLNTVNCNVMVDPARVRGEHDVFVSGNDAEAKAEVTRILTDWFGWRRVIDLGNITTARGTESYLALWTRLMSSVGSADFNIRVVP